MEKAITFLWYKLFRCPLHQGHKVTICRDTYMYPVHGKKTIQIFMHFTKCAFYTDQQASK